jgi:hypothetical protein
MRITTIPAQITTVEDRLTANLSMTQFFILIISCLLGLIIFLLIPPWLKISYLKLIILLPFFLISTLAIRIKDQLLITTLKIMIDYQLRAHIYVLDKTILDKPIKIQAKIGQDHSPTEHVFKLEKTFQFKPANLNLNRYRHNQRVIFKVNKQGGLDVGMVKN